MFNRKMLRLGEERSAIRELYEYGLARKKIVGEENVFDFSIGNPSAPPPACLTETLRRLIDEVPPELLHGYTSAPGAYDVREAVANYIRTQFGVPMSATLVYMTCGASASLMCTFQAILSEGEGEEVLVPAPFFPEYSVFVAQAGGVLVPVPTDARFHLDLAAIARAITPKTRVVLLNSPNNPTGAVYAKEELAALGQLLRKASAERRSPIFLVADEPYRELTYGEAPVYPMSVYENTVVCYSFSKSMTLAGERIGYVAVSPRCEGADELFSAVCGAGRALGFVCAPALFQKTVKHCLGAPAPVEVYRANRDLLYASLSDMGYTCSVPEGAFYLFMQALEPDARAFCERAKAFELLLVPSDSFGVGGYVRISYCVARSVIERSLPAFRALMESYRGARKN